MLHTMLFPFSKRDLILSPSCGGATPLTRRIRRGLSISASDLSTMFTGSKRKSSIVYNASHILVQFIPPFIFRDGQHLLPLRN